MWILRVNTLSQTYPKFIMKLNCWVKTGVGANLEAPKPPLNSSMAIHIRRLTTFFKVLYYLPIYSKDISETCHGIGKGVCRTNANRLIVEWQKDEKKNQKQKAEQAQKKTHKKKKKKKIKNNNNNKKKKNKKKKIKNNNNNNKKKTKKKKKKKNTKNLQRPVV